MEAQTLEHFFINTSRSAGRLPPEDPNFPAALSNFLLGETVTDSFDGVTTYTFADLDRRVQDLD